MSLTKRALCGIDGCIKPAKTLGMCSMHYERKRVHGDPLFDARAPERRFWKKVYKTPTCWVWVGALSDTGYGSFTAHGRRVAAHRFSYEQAIGAVPDGLQLDHLCRNRACVNPAHLQAVTGAENIRRATKIGYHPNAPQTCKRGHDWSETPPYLAHRSDGTVSRRCRVCQSESERRRKPWRRAS